MQYISKDIVRDLLVFIESQVCFILETTSSVHSSVDFENSMEGTVLFNSSCMCLQTIGETVKQIDSKTSGKLLSRYKEIPWRNLKDIRNFISHEYVSVDPQVIYATIKTSLKPLLKTIRKIIADVDQGKHNDVFNRVKPPKKSQYKMGL